MVEMAIRQHDEGGSVTVELALLSPVLFVFVLLAVTFGRLSEAKAQVLATARAGAQGAAIAPDAESAQWAADRLAYGGPLSTSHDCALLWVSTDVSHFYPGGSVTVQVTCQVNLSDLSVPGMPASTTIRASATAPVDPYREVQ
jgi:hypothetical protein